MREDDRFKRIRAQTQKTANENGKNAVIVFGTALLLLFLLFLAL
jgi:CHASE3 domain sensor protein